MYDMNTRNPTVGGCLDLKMGTSAKTVNCESCNKSMKDCLGHFGHVKLLLPVFHIGYIKETVRVLQSICKSCSRVLLSPKERAKVCMCVCESVCVCVYFVSTLCSMQ